MTPSMLRIATRKSPLALQQAEYTAKLIVDAHPQLSVNLVTIVTRGDKILDAPLAKMGGKGIFIKELEHAILNNHADIAVHSVKDIPMAFPEGLGLSVIMRREDPSDALVSNAYSSLDNLPTGARVGTSSLRRALQLQKHRPDLRIQPLRGNVNTRLAKLDAGDFDALILASAGLKRLHLEQRIRQALPSEICLPAVGQGAIGIESRHDDEDINALTTSLHDPDTATQIQAERAMNTRLNGGCQVPIAGHAILRDKQLWLRGLVGEPDGSKILTAQAWGSADDAETIGTSVAEDLLAQGAGEILAAVAQAHG